MAPTGKQIGVSTAVNKANPIRPKAFVLEATLRNLLEREANGANQSLQNNFQESQNRLPNDASVDTAEAAG